MEDRSMTKQNGMDRREFVKTTTGAAAAVALGPTVWIKRPQKSLKILQWSHFVPSYDAWFDKYAKDWGTAKGVEVTVDHISLADLGTRGNAAPLIKAKHPEIQIRIGVGMAQELDSNMAARARIWSFDGSVQDQNENVVLKSDHSLEALEFGVRLFKAGMNPSVMSWNAASNNQALNARQTGYILNSISAYRTAQDNKLPVADDIFFVPALKGPRGTGWASEHVMGIYVIWKFAQSPDVAKQFLLDLIGHYRDAVLGSKLYNFPSFPGSVADPAVAVAQKPAGGNKWLEQATANDPFGSNPPSKLKPIATALQWATNIGHPGPANPAESEIFDTFVLPTMFANAATGRMSAKQALDDAHQQAKKIFEKWRSKGLVAGGSGDRARSLRAQCSS